MVSTERPDGSTAISAPFLTYLDDTAAVTKADIFLLKAKPLDDAASINGNPDASNSEKLRLVIYGDMLTEEHAKIRMLIMIDQMVIIAYSCDAIHADTLLAPSIG
jgi:hypothetical protein